MPRISPTLLAAYRATDYAIQRPEGELIVRVGAHDPELTAFQEAKSARSGAYLTAWNPYSQISTPEANAAANNLLEASIAHAGLEYLPCLGRDPTGQWPAEPGFWILGGDRRWLCRLGRQFRQNAMVFVGPSARPRLICLR